MAKNNRKHPNQSAPISFAALIIVALLLVFGAGISKNDSPKAFSENENTDKKSEERVPSEDRHQDADASEDRGSVSDDAPFGYPVFTGSRSGQLIEHTGFTLQYDADFKTPQWVSWELTAEETQGSVPREDTFRPDPKVRGAKAYHKDYSNSGYDRGHIAPAADMKWSAQAMEESFYTSNICPQNRNLNRGDWKDLEELTREWAVRTGRVSVTAGPIYRSSSPSRIGNNRVGVPDAFYKILLTNYPESPVAYAFIFENEVGSRPLRSYLRTVDEVEEETKIDFFSSLPEEVEKRIESEKPDF